MKSQTKRHKHSSFIYKDVERLRIRFWSLVIRVDSVNRYFGEIKLFVRKQRLLVTTNGKLLIITEMISPTAYLGDIISNILVPLGMVSGEDFTLIKEKAVPKNDTRQPPYIEWELS